jgi:hypothetical protein
MSSSLTKNSWGSTQRLKLGGEDAAVGVVDVGFLAE